MSTEDSTGALGPLLRCPMCGGSQGYSLSEGSTYRWWDVACMDCGRCIGECSSDRRTKLGGELPERWPSADEAWNEAAAYAEGLRAYASAEVARERERCAKVCDDVAEQAASYKLSESAATALMCARKVRSQP